MSDYSASPLNAELDRSAAALLADAAAPATPARSWREWPALSVIGVLLVLVTCQARLGGRTTEVGEQVGLAIPLATPLLGLGLLVMLVHAWRRSDWRLPALPWTLAIWMAAMALGLLGLNHDDLGLAVKELVQLGEIGVGAWLLTALVRPVALPALLDRVGDAVAVLVLLCLLGVATGPFDLSSAKVGALLALGTPFLVRRTAARPVLLVAALALTGIAVGWRVDHGGMWLVWVGITLASVGVLLGAQRLVLAAPGIVLFGILSVSMAHGPAAGWHALNRSYDATHLQRIQIENAAASLAPGYFPLGGGLGAYKQRINLLRHYIPEQPHPDENKVARDSNSQYVVTLVEAGLPAALLLLVLLLTAAGTNLHVGLRAASAAARRDAKTVGLALLGVTGAALFCTILSRGVGIWVGALLGLAAVIVAAHRAGAATPADAVDAGAVPAGPVAIVGNLLGRLLLPTAAASLGLTCMLMLNLEYNPLDRISVANQTVRGAFGSGPGAVGASGATSGGLPVVHLGESDSDAGVVVRMEGEDFDRATGNFLKVQANDASGNQAMEIPIHSGKAVGEAFYELEIPEAGDYVLTARVCWQDGCSNSLAFQLGSATHVVSSELFGTWHVLQSPVPQRLAAGPMTLKVRNVEDGVRLDYLTLRRQADAVPVDRAAAP